MINSNLSGKGFFTWFFGVVECANDPKMIGRVRVRVVGDHTANKDDIPTEHLPWSTVMMPCTSASTSGIGESPTGLTKGSWVVGFYIDGKDKQQPMILGSFNGIPITAPDPAIGFNDPQMCFPHTDKLEEPDTNRLARGEEHKSVTARKASVMENVTTATSTWSEPETPYNAVYPYNKVWESPYSVNCDGCEWGHIEEWDSTPGAERYFRQHKTSQNFLEIHPDGKEVRKIYGDGFEIDLANKHLYVEGDYRVTVNGNKDERIKGDLWQHVEGNVIKTVEGDVIENYLSNYTTTVTEQILRRAKNGLIDLSETVITQACNEDFTTLSAAKHVTLATEGIQNTLGTFAPVAIEPEEPSASNCTSYSSVSLSCSSENGGKGSLSNTQLSATTAVEQILDSIDPQTKMIDISNEKMDIFHELMINVSAPIINVFGESYINQCLSSIFSGASLVIGSEATSINSVSMSVSGAFLAESMFCNDCNMDIVIVGAPSPLEIPELPEIEFPLPEVIVPNVVTSPAKSYSETSKSTTPIVPGKTQEC